MSKIITQIDERSWEVTETVGPITSTYMVYDEDPSIDDTVRKFQRLSQSDLSSIKGIIGAPEISQTPLDWQDDKAKFLVKCDDGLYRNADPSEWWHLMMQSGLLSTTPNIVNHNFDMISIRTNGWSNVNGQGMPYTRIINSSGIQTFGEPLRMINFGSCFVRLKGNGTSDFVEVDNVYMCGWGSEMLQYYDHYTIYAPNLIAISNIQFDSFLTQVNAPNLKYIGNINVGSSNTVFDFPSVEYINFLELNSQTASLNLSSLKMVNQLSVYSQQSTVFGFGNLQVVDYMQFYNNQFNTLLLPSLKYVNSLSIYNNSQLTTVDFPNLSVINETYVELSNNAFSQQTVDDILVMLANMDGQSAQYPYYFENAVIQLNGGTNQPPSAVGLNAISILTSRGCSVITN
jgi:hypothetical protein